MGNAKKIVRTILIAASFVTLLCQSVMAKGVDTNYTQVNGEVARGAPEEHEANIRNFAVKTGIPLH